MMTLHDNYFELFKYADDINGLSGSFHENYDESGYLLRLPSLINALCPGHWSIMLETNK